MKSNPTGVPPETKEVCDTLGTFTWFYPGEGLDVGRNVHRFDGFEVGYPKVAILDPLLPCSRPFLGLSPKIKVPINSIEPPLSPTSGRP